MTREQAEIMREFEKQVIKRLDQINASGGIADDTPPIVRLNYAIKLTAEDVHFATKEYRAELENLRHF